MDIIDLLILRKLWLIRRGVLNADSNRVRTSLQYMDPLTLRILDPFTIREINGLEGSTNT